DGAVAAVHARADRCEIANIAPDPLQRQIVDALGTARRTKQASHGMIGVQQPAHHRRADEAIASGHEDLHRPRRSDLINAAFTKRYPAERRFILDRSVEIAET